MISVPAPIITWLPIVTGERKSILSVCIDTWSPTFKLLFADFANDSGIITPSPIVAPFLRAIFTALAYLKYCRHRVIKPNR